jgi:prepilin peptidase CpaA
VSDRIVWAAVAVGVAATITDLRNRRVPNVLTFGAAAVGLLVHATFEGAAGAGWSAAGWLAGLALFLPLFVLGGMGAGDVKLLAALGAWLGPGEVLWVALYAAIAGGVMALAVAWWTGYLAKMITNLMGLLVFWRTAGLRPMPTLTLDTARGPRLAYAVPILAGLVIAVWLRS